MIRFLISLVTGFFVALANVPFKFARNIKLWIVAAIAFTWPIVLFLVPALFGGKLENVDGSITMWGYWAMASLVIFLLNFMYAAKKFG